MFFYLIVFKYTKTIFYKKRDHVTCRCSAALTSNMFNFAKPTSNMIKGGIKKSFCRCRAALTSNIFNFAKLAVKFLNWMLIFFLKVVSFGNPLI